MPEGIMHNVNPWKKRRKGYGDSILLRELFPKERIMGYYVLVNRKYKIKTGEGLMKYIHAMLKNILKTIFGLNENSMI